MSLNKALSLLSKGALDLALKLVSDYVAKRIRRIHPDDLLEALDKGDCSIINKLSEKDRETIRKFARIPQVAELALKHLTVRNVFEWLARAAPFHAGMLYAHPNGIKCLEKAVDEIRNLILDTVAPVVEAEVVEGGGGEDTSRKH